MKARLTQRNVLLETGSVLALDDAQGWQLSCQRGRLWITVEGSAQEVTLSQGRGVTIEGDGRVVVEADGASVLTLCPRRVPSAPASRGIADLARRLSARIRPARASAKCVTSMRLA